MDRYDRRGDGERIQPDNKALTREPTLRHPSYHRATGGHPRNRVNFSPPQPLLSRNTHGNGLQRPLCDKRTCVGSRPVSEVAARRTAIGNGSVCPEMAGQRLSQYAPTLTSEAVCQGCDKDAFAAPRVGTIRLSLAPQVAQSSVPFQNAPLPTGGAHGHDAHARHHRPPRRSTLH